MPRGYRIRSYVTNRSKDGQSEYKTHLITVPTDIAQKLPDGISFMPRMTEQGLLYEPLENINIETELPEWAKGKNEGEEGKDQEAA